jgi:hypothetical protein
MYVLPVNAPPARGRYVLGIALTSTPSTVCAPENAMLPVIVPPARGRYAERSADSAISTHAEPFQKFMAPVVALQIYAHFPLGMVKASRWVVVKVPTTKRLWGEPGSG